MNCDIWLQNKIVNSTLVNIYTTKCFPVFAPSTNLTPYIVYDSIGYEKNLKLINKVYTIMMFHNSKANVELINDGMYSLFDNSTKFQKDTSSNLSIESIKIITNNVTRYDETNKNWVKVMDISVWYSNN